MAIQVLPAERSDKEAIAKLEDSTWNHGYFKALEIAESMFSDKGNSKVFVVKEAGKLVGYIEVSLNGVDADIGFLAVEKSHRRNGIGRALVEKAIDYAEDMECEKITLEVHPDNIAAILLYSKMGFVAVRTYDKQSKVTGKTVRKTVMEKILTAPRT